MSFAHHRLIASFTHKCDAWIVGSAADPENKNPRDWDILIPFSKWEIASGFIPEDATVNSFGGWKIKTTEGIEIDVWPGELGSFLQSPKCKYAWHLKTDTRIKIEN